jgi:hypothetical protein
MAGDERFTSQVAIDLIGPGGGQWTLGLLSDGTLKCEQGLIHNADSLITLSVEEFKGMLQEPIASIHKHATNQFFPISYGAAPKSRAHASRETANG